MTFAHKRPFLFLIGFLLLGHFEIPAAGLNGIFDAGWSTWYFGADSLQTMHARLHQMGVTTVVLQYAVVEGAHRYYPSTLDFTQDEPNREVFIPQSLAAATAAGNTVWLGLYYNQDWWNPPSNAQLDTLAARNIRVLHELHTLYGSNPVIQGVYIPQELARYYWPTSGEQDNVTTHFLRPLTDSAHALGWQVMASPFFNTALETPQQWGAFLSGLFAHWHPDVIAVQDGIGAGHVNFADLGNYLRAAQSACSAENISFEVDAELFEGSALASKDRITQQLDSAWAAGAGQVVGYDLSVLGGDGLTILAGWQADYIPTPIRTTPRLTKAPVRVIPLQFDLLGRIARRIQY